MEEGLRLAVRKGYKVQRFELSWLLVAGEHFLQYILQCKALHDRLGKRLLLARQPLLHSTGKKCKLVQNCAQIQ